MIASAKNRRRVFFMTREFSRAAARGRTHHDSSRGGKVFARRSYSHPSAGKIAYVADDMTKRLPQKRDILALLERERRPMHTHELAQALDVSPGMMVGFERVMDDLAYEGIVVPRPGHKFVLRQGRGLEEHRARERDQERGRGQERGTDRGRDRVHAHGREEERDRKPSGARGQKRTGILSMNARRFGFVSSVEHPGEDVFIPEEAIGGAMHGDTVEIEIVARSSRGLEGAIDKIVARGTKRVAGVLRRKGRSTWLEPDDTRVRGPIDLTSAVDTQGPAGNSGEDGDAAIVRITRWPEFQGENPVGAIEIVLGRPGELSVETQKIVAMGQIEEQHSEDAIREAEAYGVEVPREMLEGRVDLTDLPLPTIDPEDARDHDDAVWVERTENGGYRAVIAIADVSSYVRPGTKLDEEAQARGCSVYLPERAIPMLPRALSSNLCSLLPDVIRLCLAVDVTLDSGGRVVRSEVVRGFMKSQAKLTYGGVARALGFSAEPPRQEKAEEMRDGLRTAYELSRLLRNKRRKRGALDFDLPEPKIILDEGVPVNVEKRAHDPGVKKAYELIEELMLLANEIVAELTVTENVPAIYRVHLPPDEQKLDRLAAMCGVLGVEFDPEATKDPKSLQALLASFAEHPLSSILNSLLLRSMKQATYEPQNMGHFGLASKAYLHFTSPIRRYPDLVVHRAIHQHVLRQKIDRSEAARERLAQAALDASQAERRSMEVERGVADLYRAFVMKDRIGERHAGVVTAVVGGGVFCAIDSPFIDVLVKLQDLGPGDWQPDDDGLRVNAGRSGDSIALGDDMMLEITEVSLFRRTIYARRLGGGGRDGEQADRDRKKKKHVSLRHERKQKSRRQEGRGQKKKRR
jgi:ribonuclease R